MSAPSKSRTTVQYAAAEALRRLAEAGVTQTDLANSAGHDIDLGRDGSKWRHGWVPLNAVAAAIKAKTHVSGGGGGTATVSSRRPGKGRGQFKAEVDGKVVTGTTRGKGKPRVRSDKVDAAPTVRATMDAERTRRGESLRGGINDREARNLFRPPSKSSALPVDKNVDAHELDDGTGELRTRDGAIAATGFKSKRAAQIRATKHNAVVNAERERAKRAEDSGTVGGRSVLKSHGNHGDARSTEAPKTRAELKNSPTFVAARAEAAKRTQAKLPAKAAASKERAIASGVREPDAPKPTKGKRGHYLIATETKRQWVGPVSGGKSEDVSTSSLHRVVSADPLGRPTKVEDVSTGMRFNYNPTRYGYGESIPGHEINDVALDRATSKRFDSREEALAHLNAHKGAKPKRVVRVPDGLAVERAKEGRKGFVVMHTPSQKSVGAGYSTKADAENAATHLGSTGVDFSTDDTSKLIAEVKKATADLDDGHPVKNSMGMSYGGKVEPVHEGDHDGKTLSPSTPKAKPTKEAAREAAVRELGERLNGSTATPAEKVSDPKIGQKLSYTVEGKQRTGAVWSTGNGLYTTSKHPDTGKVEMHEVYGSRATVVDTQRNKLAAEMQAEQHARNWRSTQTKRVQVGTERKSAGTGFKAHDYDSPVYENRPIDVRDSPSRHRDGSAAKGGYAEVAKRAHAELSTRLAEKMKGRDNADLKRIADGKGNYTQAQRIAARTVLAARSSK